MSSTNSIIKPSKVMFNFALYLMLAYFIYHVLSGERGLFSYMRLNHELQEKDDIMQELQVERLSLEKKVELMNSKNIDADTLDELARQNLGLMSKDEEVWIIEGADE